MAALKAVPSEPVDLSEFGVAIAKGEERWRQVIDQLSAVDEAKLRAALLQPSIAPTAIASWLDRRKIGVHQGTIRKWRAKGYAVDA